MRRRRSTLTASMSIGTPAGNPSTMAVSPGPCDSPAVKKRSAMGASPVVAAILPEPLRRRQLDGARCDDLGRQEDEQLLVVVVLERPLEEPAERGDVVQIRDAVLVVGRRVPEDAAQDDRLPVLD